MMRRYVEVMEDVLSGNIYRLFGVDQFLVKPDTITTFTNKQNLNIKEISLSSIVRVVVEPKNPAHSEKLVEGFQWATKQSIVVAVRSFLQPVVCCLVCLPISQYIIKRSIVWADAQPRLIGLVCQCEIQDTHKIKKVFQISVNTWTKCKRVVNDNPFFSIVQIKRP
ncbi:uncharacterized protein LOC143205675 [Rhynchophorus ferrugineus]|uniref:uncharacterized protein LOC143205675 n=1 Tax=Rhynchophorus ferrugineus TaxID=354439 RepID=UPI003FCE39F1